MDGYSSLDSHLLALSLREELDTNSYTLCPLYGLFRFVKFCHGFHKPQSRYTSCLPLQIRYIYIDIYIR